MSDYPNCILKRNEEFFRDFWLISLCITLRFIESIVIQLLPGEPSRMHRDDVIIQLGFENEIGT